ncbi:hypothetical protein SAMN05216480_101771 [Pustulibacterium marinum]|uniref:CoA-binding domain-containing protein n=1 Tax=Pustulibacterium marinum TaxID=1224947 RepID=A0A1I7F9N8_9FLAO|nr:CoA-binding protein [Pustulibacterium marinum]SFU32884.1 hypothetical protein SAMN05216480_101771 [Pustulibacterium marinum]
MKTLVIGASEKRDRYSNIAINKLLDAGHEVVAIGTKPGEVRGVSFATEKEDFQEVNTVTLYINPMIQEAYYSYILKLNPERVIFNPGTENPEFMKLLRDHGIESQVACTLVLLSTNQY